jgi:Zn finger protein HypA/HybF involved in hydrogenase expression
MTIALVLLTLGVGINLVMLTQVQKGFPRFANTCKGCGCQAPPMEYPPAVYECPICQWMVQQNLWDHLKLSARENERGDR